MTVGRLTDLHDYRLGADVLDARGWRCYDANHVHVGFIEDYVVDTETGQLITAILHFEGVDHELPVEQLTLDGRAQQVHLGHAAAALRALPSVPGWHPVDRHRVRATFFPELAKLDDWGEVELEDIRRPTP